MMQHDKRPVTLSVEGLNKSFFNAGKEIPALQDISFEVRRREFIAVVGASGCGKSTLIRMLAGLENPTGGQVLLDGEPVQGAGPDRGMVFQGFSLFPWLTVKKNIMFGLRVQGASPSSAEQQAMQWIDLVGLEQFANHFPGELSGGMQQRVAIARALAPRPKILLMDEPFGALDARTRQRMQGYLLDIWRNVDVTIMFVTHDLDEAVFLADRVLVLKPSPGRIDAFLDVPLPRPRDQNIRSSSEFAAFQGQLEALIHTDESPDDTPPNLFRLTQVGDEVDS